VNETWPFFDEDETRAVTRVLTSGRVNYWTGDEVSLFEDAYCAYVGRKHAIALNNGTLALELALRAFGIGPGDEVITTPRTFIATASAIVLSGATPRFADIDPRSQNITAETVAPVITSRTRAIIPVHLGGWPCNMPGLMQLADAHDLVVIEDCAQAHGAEFERKPVGAFGHAAAFSFCQDKIISTGGEGGMLLLDDDSAWRAAWAFKDHGKDYERVNSTEHPPGFRWLHNSFGTNWRMTEMPAAIGRIQLTKLDAWVDRRQENAHTFRGVLEGLPVSLARPSQHEKHAYYRLYLLLEPGRLRSNRQTIQEELNKAGVSATVGSCPEIYLERAFEGHPSRPVERLPVARDVGERSIAFEVHPTLQPTTCTQTAEVVRATIARHLR
jgi:dTDP-4-amino-4,6-dideoxygalactose transaminase